MTEQRVSTRYARSILETANQENITGRVLEDFYTVLEMIKASRELQNLIDSPIVQYWKKKKVFTELFSPVVSELTMKFINLLTEKRREKLISHIIIQYEKLYNKLNGRLPIEIFSAIELSDEIKNKITEKMKEKTGKTVLTSFIIDPSLKGGMLIKVDDWVFDASVKNQLEKLFEKLASGQAIS